MPTITRAMEAMAAAKQQDQAEQLLPILLQHPSITQQQQTVCALLCASKGTRATISQLLHGQMTISFNGHDAEHLPWLAQHGHLIKSMDLRMAGQDAAAVAEALEAAAGTAAPLGLRLQSFKSDTCSSTILQQLPGSCLTSLQLNIVSQAAEFDLAASAEALAQLTALRTLDIQASSDAISYDEDDITFNELLPALPALHALTGLTLMQLGPEDNLQQYLPPQLLELNIALHEDWFSIAADGEGASDDEDVYWEYKERVLRQAVYLGQLTALTKLEWEVSCMHASRPQIMVKEGDVLPPNLKALDITNFTSVQPLLQLQQLERLTVHGSTAPAQELRQLSGLTALSEVALTHWEHGASVGAAAAWSALPLKYLDLSLSHSMGASIVQHLSLLQMLTHLSLSSFETPQTVCSMLQQLTGLHTLNVSRPYSQLREPVATPDADGYVSLVGAIVRLTQLNKLVWSCEPLGRVAVSQLAAATQLTCLEFDKCDGVDDGTVAALADGLTGLKELSISFAAVTDAVVPAIADHLQQLTSLDVSGTSVGDAGAVHLSRLGQLKELRGWNVSYAARQKALRQ